MSSRFRWPFSLTYLYTVDEFRPSSQPPSSTPIATSKPSNQRRTFRWPFSLEYLYTVDEFRPLASSTPPYLVSVVADWPNLPEWLAQSLHQTVWRFENPSFNPPRIQSNSTPLRGRARNHLSNIKQSLALLVSHSAFF